MPTLEELAQQVEALGFEVSSFAGQIKDLQFDIDMLRKSIGSGGGSSAIDEFNAVREKLAKLSAVSNFDAYEDSKNTNSIPVAQTTFYIFQNSPRNVYYERSSVEMIQITLELASGKPVASESALVYYLESDPSFAFTLILGGWMKIGGQAVFFER